MEVIDLSAVRTFTDAVRWWGALGAVFTLHDFGIRVSHWMQGKPHPPVLGIWADAWAKALVCAFVFCAGAAIPFFDRFDGAVATLYMALMWPLLSGSVWLYTTSRSASPWGMVLVSLAAFALMLTASMATVARYA